MLNRKRFNIRKIVTIKNTCIAVVATCAIILSSVFIGGQILKNKVASSTVVFKSNDESNLNNGVLIGDSKENNEKVNNSDSLENSTDLKNQDEVSSLLNEETKESYIPNGNDDIVTINLLGELMMGGSVTKNLDYSYSSAVKGIYSTTRQADFTYCNFSTNITNLEKIENSKSKYLVTSNILSTLEALGLDSVSIASDHIIDFPSDILKNTISILEKNDIFVAGRKDMPVYFEKGNKKIAIVSTNSVIIGTAKNYTNNDISIYSKENLKKNIEEAKQSADIVIADIHWGRDHTYGLTDQMREYAKTAIDLGADMVIGSHALGVYPIVKYKDKPIIYSLGYLMSDLDYNVAKEGFIFKLKISKDAKIESLEMTPIYIENKEKINLYSEYDKLKSTEYLNQFNNWHIENGLNSKILDDKIYIEF